MNVRTLPNWIRQHYMYVVIAILIFSISGIVGAYNLNEMITDQFTELQEEVIDQDGFFIFLRIFLQNTFVCFLLVFGGLVGGIPTLFVLIFNGYIQGMLLRFFAEQITLRQVLIGIIPHGIFELSAFFIAAGWGLYCGLQIFQQPFKTLAKKSLVIFISIIPLLLIAAIIETAAILLALR